MERHIVQGYIVPSRHMKIFRRAGKRTTLYLGISSLKKRVEFRLAPYIMIFPFSKNER